LSPAQADEASLWLVIVLAVLLAVSLAAVIMSPSPPGGRHAKEGGAEPGFPGSGHEPPEVPVPVQYGGQVMDTGTGRTWRCPHNHPTQESAVRCADAMQERIKRLGWEKATGGGQ